MATVTEPLLIAIAALAVVQIAVLIAVLIAVWKRTANAGIVEQINSLAIAQSGLDRVLVDALGKLRTESAKDSLAQRQELASAFGQFRSEQSNAQKDQRESLEAALSRSREESGKSAQKSREELTNSLERFSNQLGSFETHTNERSDSARAELTAAHKEHRESVVTSIAKLEQSNERKLDSIRTTLVASLDHLREQSGQSAQTTREELTTSMMAMIKQLSETVARTMTDLGNGQREQLMRFSNQLESFEIRTNERSDAVRAELTAAHKEHRESVVASIAKLEQSNEHKLDAIRTTVEGKLQSLREDNTKQLEQMRMTVDEKLHSTLEKRLGESFKQVSERLEQVHKGLGEMQSLANGVGDLKKVLTNVKARGTWGEVQLGALLEQVLSQDQYATNVATKGTGERVEFAIKLPGQDKTDQVWLPIDAKFPIEDWQRLLDAQERGDADGMEAAGRQLEVRIKGCAADISRKYVNPPQTTDFAILFLPIEGLFAEVLRRNGLTDLLQREHRVVVAGPTTLWSILNSLQMGFRTLAIQQRSSEVWNLLAAVKTEWTKYGDVLDLVQKRLHQASESIDKVKVRSRAVERKLRDVQELPAAEAGEVLAVDEADLVDADEDIDGAPVAPIAPASLRH